jgi:Predicted hydrolases or acyltransferases (alpha/beta hydrolase superfamily)
MSLCRATKEANRALDGRQWHQHSFRAWRQGPPSCCCTRWADARQLGRHFSALSERFRTLRYDQRGSGLSEKVRQPITTEILEEDLEAVLQESGLPPPYHFVTVAAATMQALIYMTKHPDRVASFVFCNPFTGADPSRVAALEQRAGLAEREGLRKAIPTTLDNSWPPDIGDPAAYATYRGRYLAHDPVCFASMNRAIARPNVTHLAKEIRRPTMVVAGRFDQVRPPAPASSSRRPFPTRASS